MKSIPMIKLRGSAESIGMAHGAQLKEQIRSTWMFYSQTLFGNQSAFLEHYGKLYLQTIYAFSNYYGTEIEAIAEGSGLFPWQIAVLNSRTEIFHRLMQGETIGECTAVYFPGTRILGQNWDWMNQLEPLIVVMEIERNDGHRILQMTEPGIIGKIGLNSKGLGACLNILPGSSSYMGVPVHILLRSALDGDDIESVHEQFQQMTQGTYSNILLADDKGRAIDMEFGGNVMEVKDYGSKPPLHTNHYLSSLSKTHNKETDFLYNNSLARYERGNELLQKYHNKAGISELKSVLMDTENKENPICARYKPLLGLEVGTVSSLIMDLPGRAMYVTSGNPNDNPYEFFSLL